MLHVHMLLCMCEFVCVSGVKYSSFQSLSLCLSVPPLLRDPSAVSGGRFSWFLPWYQSRWLWYVWTAAAGVFKSSASHHCVCLFCLFMQKIEVTRKSEKSSSENVQITCRQITALLICLFVCSLLSFILFFFCAFYCVFFPLFSLFFSCILFHLCVHSFVCLFVHVFLLVLFSLYFFGIDRVSVIFRSAMVMYRGFRTAGTVS